MGRDWSWLSQLLPQTREHPKSPPKLVLVPPLFERDHRGRSRMAKSGYDWSFGQPARKWLFGDYLQEGQAAALLRLSPAQDRRISVTARLNSSVEVLDSKLNKLRVGKATAGSVTLRYQPNPDEQLTFVDLKAAVQDASKAKLRFCMFDQARRLGVFGSLPLLSGAATPNVMLGARYTSPELTAGAMVRPLQEQIDAVWAAHRSNGFTLGVQWRPTGRLRVPGRGQGPAALDQLWEEFAKDVSIACAYSPADAATTFGKGTFTAAIELQQQRRLVISFLHHQAMQRVSRYFFEDRDIVGVTSYLDVGVQGNKNLMLKGKVGTDGVHAALAFKSWSQPSWWLSIVGGYGFREGRPRVGVSIGMENHGKLRYERSEAKSVAFGRALVQRHVALESDVANFEGRGMLVDDEKSSDPRVLGQDRQSSSYYL